MVSSEMTILQMPRFLVRSATYPIVMVKMAATAYGGTERSCARVDL